MAVKGILVRVPGCGSRSLGYTRTSVVTQLVMRNCCAHHARLFDRKFYGYRPLNEWRNTPTATLDTRTFFAQLLLVYRMLRPLPSVCFDRTRWRRVVYRLLRDTPNCSVFDMDRIMDIPADCRKKFLWQ